MIYTALLKLFNTKTIQAFQSICLLLISGVPWYITNDFLHKYLGVPTLRNLKCFSYLQKTHKTFNTHNNLLINCLTSIQTPNNPFRRLKRKCCGDLLFPNNLLTASGVTPKDVFPSPVFFFIIQHVIYFIVHGMAYRTL